MIFKKALLVFINDKGIKKGEFAEGIMKSQQLSSYLSGTAPTLATLKKIYLKYPEFKKYMDRDEPSQDDEVKLLLIEQQKLLKELAASNKENAELLTQILKVIKK